MASFDLADAARAVPELGRVARDGVRVADVATDSRRAGPGTLFFALEGTRTDGHRYVADVLARGAAACVVRCGRLPSGTGLIEVDEPLATLGRVAAFVRRRLTCRVIAITGSLGKTTAKDMLAAVLEGSFAVARAPESFNNALGVPLTILGVAPHAEVLVSEVGANHFGEISALADILRPDDGLIVSIAPVHLEGFGSIDGVIEAKGELAAALPQGGTLFLNAGVPGAERLRRRAPCRVIAFGEGTDTPCAVVAADRAGVAFRVGTFGTFRIPGAGVQHVPSAAAAVVVAREYGVKADDIRARLGAFAMPRLRWQIEDVRGVLVITDCYNASPDSVRGAIDAACALRAGGRVAAVLGDMGELGDHALHYHGELGEHLAGARVARVFLYGAEVRATRDALARAGRAGDTALFEDGEALAREVARSLAPGDAVLFKASRRMRLEVVARRVKELLAGGARGAERT